MVRGAPSTGRCFDAAFEDKVRDQDTQTTWASTTLGMSRKFLHLFGCCFCLESRALALIWRMGCSGRRILGKFQAHALRLWTKLPEAQTYWLPTLPSLTEPRAFSTVAGNFGAPQTSEGHTIQPDQSEATAPIARCTVTVIMPLGLPGMGKSSLLEQVFRLAQASALKAYRQGKLQKSSEGGAEHGFNQLHAVAMLSSDAFTGDELKAMGMDAAKSSSQDVVPRPYQNVCLLLGTMPASQPSAAASQPSAAVNAMRNSNNAQGSVPSAGR